MSEQKSFKERVKETLISNAYSYKKYYVDYEYLLCSKAFEKCEYYIVATHEDNYLHLTGVHTGLDAATFFEKCYKGTLEETDFDFSKKRQNENEVKGSVRRKINSLPAIMNKDFTTGFLAFVYEDICKNIFADFFVGECKYHAKSVDASVYFTLKEKVANASDIKKAYPGYDVMYGVFSKSGFTKRLLDVAKENAGLILINEDHMSI